MGDPDDRVASELRGQAEALGVSLDPGQIGQLLDYEGLLLSRGVELGVVSKDDAARLRERHMLDSLRATLAADPDDGVALDLGSGGGLPGIPVAVAKPGLRMVLVESRRARSAFLELAVERLGLRNTVVHVGRIEELSVSADLCFARALAPLLPSWALAEPHLRPGGRLVYFAGARSEAPEPPPGTRLVSILRAPSLASAGALVIIGRP